MWEIMFDLLDGISDGLFSLNDKPDSCFGCLFQAIGITIGIFSAIMLFTFGIGWQSC